LASKPMSIGYATLAVSITWVVLVELLIRAGLSYLPLPPLAMLGLGRVLEMGGMLGAVIYWENGLEAIGWSPRKWPRGLMQGALWSMGFALAAGIGMLLVHLTGRHPLSLLRSPLAARPADRMLFFLVGGLIAPIAEEICFRGILYGFFRRWGIVAALAASTAVFVVLHSTRGLPVTQIVGGLVFALAYETSRNLMVPITIHVLGNLAIFSLSLVAFVR
jgi:CAAX protease family protein